MSETAPFFSDLADAPDGASAFWCSAPDGVRVRGAVWRTGSRGTILLLSGRSEYIEKYGLIIRRLAALGFSVVTLDWRGQGLSDRPDNSTELGHVEAFGEYQSDLDAVLATAEAADLPEPRIMMAHSMGGCIGLRRLLRDDRLAGAIFSAPMWGIGMPRLMRLIASGLTRLALLFGRGKSHAPGTNAAFYVLDCTFEENTLTTDRDQFERMKRHLQAQPSLGLGGPSMSWVRAAMDELRLLFASRMPEIPVLTFLGSDETIVDPAAIERLMPRFPSGELVHCENARHEIWMESEAIQTPVWQKMEAFLDRLAPRS